MRACPNSVFLSLGYAWVFLTGKQTKQHPKQISYETSFNVLTNSFTVEITIDELIPQKRGNKYKQVSRFCR